MSGVIHKIVHGVIVSEVCEGRTNKEISEFNKIPMSMVKKDFTNFIDLGKCLEDYDITRKNYKRYSNTHDHDIVARVQKLVNTDPLKSMRAMAPELELSATLVIYCYRLTFSLHYTSGLVMCPFFYEDETSLASIYQRSRNLFNSEI